MYCYCYSGSETIGNLCRGSLSLMRTSESKKTDNTNEGDREKDMLRSKYLCTYPAANTELGLYQTSSVLRKCLFNASLCL